MSEILEILSTEWAIRAMITSIMVGITCGLIGCFIVLRNMSMIGDALSHSILPGIYFSFIIVGYSTLGFFVGSVVAAIITSIAITWIQHNVKTKNDAAIGIVFTAMFSIGVIGISRLNNTQGNHLDLKDFLFGNILGISNEDILISAIVMIYIIICLAIFYRYFFLTTFQPIIAETMGVSTKMIHYFLMLMLSFAVVAALRSVGVILVVAMLITPASTALLLSKNLRRVLVISAIIGMISSILGILLAIIYNTTPGPAIVLVATGVYTIVALLSPEKGLIPNYIRNRRISKKILQEDILKRISKVEGKPTFTHLSEYLGIAIPKLKKEVNQLTRDGMITNAADLALTLKGRATANGLIRAHRLWESYQVSQMGMADNQIHDDAERLEHLMTPEFVDEIDTKLGYPTSDPHGSPIPQRMAVPPNPLLQLKPKKRAYIAKEQINDNIESELWEIGLLPDAEIYVKNINTDNVTITSGGKTIVIPEELARKINVLLKKARS